MTDPRIAVLSALSSPGWHPVPEAHGMPWDEAEQLLAAYDASRAAAPSASATRGALRDRIADTLAAADGWRWVSDSDKAQSSAYQGYQTRADAVLSVLPATTDRAAILREAADAVAADTEIHIRYGSATDYANRHADLLRRMAGEAQGADRCSACRYIPCDNCRPAAAGAAVAGHTGDEGSEAEASPVCQGFQWIGQSFATCDRCGQPAWEHDGEDVPVEGAGPFDTRSTVRPWKPGQADAMRAKWGTPAAGLPAGGAPQPKEADAPRSVCVCGHTRAEHLTVSGRLLCDACDPDSTSNLVCRGFDAL